MIERAELIAAMPYCLTETNLPLAQKYPGKVRDTYDLGDGRLLLITTDRQSGFDRMLGAVIDMASWTPQPIFGLMQRLGSIETVEMNRAFNMGVGLVVIAKAGLQQELTEAMKPFRVWELGRVKAGVEGVLLDGVGA